MRHRIYMAVKTFDTYVTSSLGLPRTLRHSQAASQPKDAPYMGSLDALLAADANVELLDLLGATIDKAYFTNMASKAQDCPVVRFDQLREVGKKLADWAQRYAPPTQLAPDNLSKCSK